MDHDTAVRQLADLETLRAGVRASLTRRGDALMDLLDAVITHPGRVDCLPALSLDPAFRRGHASVYAALADGRIDEPALRAALASAAPPGDPPVYAVDVSPWARPAAAASPGRGVVHLSDRYGGRRTAGWNFSVVARVDPSGGAAWAHPADIRRLDPAGDTWHAQTGIQIRDVAALAPAGSLPLFVLDAGYGAPALARALEGTGATVLVRGRRNARLFRDVPPRPPGTGGRPRIHGARISFSSTPPDEELAAVDDRGMALVVRAWHRVHAGARGRGPLVSGTVLEIQTDSDMPPLVLFWAGPRPVDLDLAWRAYRHRFDIEHLFRFWKRDLGWTVPAVRTPEQASRWAWILAAAHAVLGAARDLVAEVRLPWHRPLEPARLTPGRTRRGFAALLAQLVVRSKPPKPSTPGSGWPRGRPRGPATRFPVVLRTPRTH